MEEELGVAPDVFCSIHENAGTASPNVLQPQQLKPISPQKEGGTKRLCGCTKTNKQCTIKSVALLPW